MSRVALLTSEAIDRTLPHGFQPKDACVAEALASHHELTLVDVTTRRPEPFAHEASLVELAHDRRTVVVGEAAAARLARRRPAPVRALGVAWQALRGDTSLQVGDLRSARASIAALPVASFDLVVLMQKLAHLAPAVAPMAPCLTILEEGHDRYLALEGAASGRLTALQRGLRRGAWERLYRSVGSASSMVTAISDLERFHLSTFIPVEKLAVVPPTVDPDLLALEPPRPSEHPPRILVSGRFDQGRALYRGLANTVRTCDARVRAAGGPPPTWVLAGQGAGAVAAGEAVVECWTGSRLAEVYAGADFVLVGGRTITGVRTTFLQGLAAGRPTIASWDTLWTAGAQSGVHAWGAAGATELADTLAAVLEHDPTAVAARGRDLFVERYSWPVVGTAALTAAAAALRGR